MLAYGEGPDQQDHPQASRFTDDLARFDLGGGPLLVSGSPVKMSLPDRQLEFYPIREFLAAVHPTRNLLVRALPPDARLVISDIEGDKLKEVIEFDSPQRLSNGISWSADGEWFAYMLGEMFGTPETEADIWKVRLDGTEAHNLTPDSPGNDGFPSFSADGRWLTFRSGRSGNYDVYLANADGTEVRNLTNDPANDVFPALSPNGRQLAFCSDRDSLGTRIYEIYILDIDTAGNPGTLKRITHNDVQEGHPHYSPDGEWLIYTSERAGINDEEALVQAVLFSPQMYGELFAYRVRDGMRIRLTHNKWEDGMPNWAHPFKSE